MADAENRRENRSYLFDLMEKNLPEQEPGEDIQPISTLEFLIWMICLSGVFIIIRYIYVLFFSPFTYL